MLQPEQIREFVEKNPRLVVRKESTRYPGLYVLKYHNRVFYDALWQPELMEMRGLVVDKDYNIICYPFTKIFNRGENGTDIPLDEPVTAVRKINGFMAALTVDPVHGPIVSTTGSLDSPYADLARKHIMKGFDSTAQEEVCEGQTLIFEICDKEDPHIIPEQEGAYLLNIRYLPTFSDPELHWKLEDDQSFLDDLVYMAFWNFRRPDWWRDMPFQWVVDKARRCEHEGFVVYGKNTTLKIKSPYYLTKKLFARIRDTKLTEDFFNKINVEEEYYPLVDFIKENVVEFSTMDEQSRLTFIRDFLSKGQ